MFQNFDDLQTLGQTNADAVVKSFSAVSQSAQAIADELADYSKRSFEQGSVALEKMLGVTSLDSLFEVQTGFAKTAYEGFVSEATKLGTLYAELAREIARPLEGVMGPLGGVAK